MGASRSLPQSLFAILCLLGVIAIAVGALLEVARVRNGVSIISLRQLRLRVFSAVIWIIILGSLSFSVLFLWPQPGNLVQAKHFARVITGVLWLLGIALLLLFYDVLLVGRERRQQQARFNQELTAMAQAEIERARHEHELKQAQGQQSSNHMDGAGSASNDSAKP